jgi:hypothetical protein
MSQQKMQERGGTRSQPGAKGAALPGPQQARLADVSAKLNAAPAVQRVAAIAASTAQPAVNKTGLPDRLKAGVEALSGFSMDHVRVHRDSPKPAQLNAHAYAQGSDIHLAPGQERHLPHEAWHLVQQAQGRVQPTRQLKEKVPINDDRGLEREADRMGAKAAQLQPDGTAHAKACGCPGCAGTVAQVQTVQAQAIAQLAPCTECGVDGGHAPNCTRAVQEERGLHMGLGLQIHGGEMGRIPHGTGGVAASGSARAATHDHGNQQATTQAVNSLVFGQGIARNQITQSSVVRTLVKAKDKEEKAESARVEKKAAKKGKSDEALRKLLGFSPDEWAAEPESAKKAYRKQYA